MCGRFALTISPEVLARIFNLQDSFNCALEPRYNIGPGSPVAAVMPSQDTQHPALSRLHWGLVPHWQKNNPTTRQMINIRSEPYQTAPHQPQSARQPFLQAFSRRRCLIPASGFYEWKTEGRVKQPWFFRRKNQDIMALAAVWEEFRPDPANPAMDKGCAIITTDCNDLVRPIHNRMPVIVPPAHFDLWLHSAQPVWEIVKQVSPPCPPDEMERFRVSTAVNRMGHDHPDCVKPLPDNEIDNNTFWEL